MDEKRAVLRRRTYYAARLSSPDGIAWSDAVVRNLSAAGALIEMRGSPLPERLDVAIPMAGVHSRARVSWRDGARAGLQFLAMPNSPSKPVAARCADDASY